MTEFEEHEDTPMIEPDPSHIAYLDQQSAAFESEREDFVKLYGFDHECTCGTDYTSNRVGMVTECFLRLSADALNRCAYLNSLNGALNEALDHALGMTNDLIELLRANGLEDKVDEYFASVTDLDDSDDQDAYSEYEAELKQLTALMESVDVEENDNEEEE